LLLLMSLCKEY